MGGILTITMLSSIGFHYFETVNQSLHMQWIAKDRAPQLLGWLMAAGSAATLIACAAIVLTWKAFSRDYTLSMWSRVGSRRYWHYDALQLMAGARRQIFVVFAGFMMVEKFGFSVEEMTGLFMVNLVVNILCTPILGRVVAQFGEKLALNIEQAGLAVVFLAYGGLYWFGWGVLIAAAL